MMCSSGLLLITAVAGFTAPPHSGWHVARGTPLLRSFPQPLLALLPEEPLPELPSRVLLEAIAACGSSATAADVAVESGLEIAETRRQLLSLARLVGAELQVSEDGELLFVFEQPGALRRSLRTSSLRQRGKDAWTTVSPPIFWALRASFGVGLLASLALVTTAITVLASSKDDSSSSASRSVPSVGMLWGPSPFDFLYYSTRPYGYREPSGEKGFLQSCFSLLFGDGNPNVDLSQRTSIAAANVIRANGGAVTAEQLAPILAPPIDPAQAEEEALRPGAPLREDWMLPILLQFNGEPVVTEDGDIVYVFPELMASADDEVADALGAAGGVLVPAEAKTSLRRALVYTNRPPGWRPSIGERVVVSRVGATRRRDDRTAARFIGLEGTVMSDDRDGLPFGVGFGSAAQDRPDSFFSLEEILPVGADSDGVSLQELPQRFSTAPPSQLAFAGLLGAANLGAVVYLGALLGRVAGVPAAALGSSGPLVLLLRRAYLPLLAYASGWVAVPAVRASIVRRRNRRIDERNARRAQWGRAIDVDAVARSEPSEGRGLRARLSRKLEAARKLRPTLRRFKRDADATYSTAGDLAAGNAKPESLTGSGFEEFDLRLRKTGDGGDGA